VCLGGVRSCGGLRIELTGMWAQSGKVRWVSATCAIRRKSMVGCLRHEPAEGGVPPAKDVLAFPSISLGVSKEV
jgi:hypothetical protein